MSRASAAPKSRPASTYRCAECGWQTARWAGRCGECQAWGTLEAAGTLRPVRPATAAVPPATAARPIEQVDAGRARSRPTGIAELDRALGGGLVAGGVVLLAGEPGVGKSTLLLAAAAAAASSGLRCLYVCAEESAAQVRRRADRVGAVVPGLFLAAETDLSAVLGQIDATGPELLIVDSVQTVGSADVDGAVGGVGQVRAVAAALSAVAKDRGIATVLVGHVTKDGSVAGPRALEHLVDVVCHLDGERQSRLRLLRAVKNRFGPTDEVGCFDLSETGLRSLPDPSGLFLSRRATPVSGTCVTVAMEGRRSLVVEVQALVAGGPVASPRRATSGLSAGRVAMALAVAERRLRVPLAGRDVYAATVGGVRVTEPAADLALVLAVASSARDAALPARLVAVGEVGLSGDVRPVGGLRHRLAEAGRLGFTAALVPPDPGPLPAGLRVYEVGSVAAAADAALQLGAGRA